MAARGPLNPAMTLTVTESLVTPGAKLVLPPVPPPDDVGPPGAVPLEPPGEGTPAARPPPPEADEPAAPTPAAPPSLPPAPATPSAPDGAASPLAAACWPPVRTNADSWRGVD